MPSKLPRAVRIAAPFRNIAFDERAPRDRRRRPSRGASRSIAAPAELRGRDHAARRRAVSAVSTPAAVEEVPRGRARARALVAAARGLLRGEERRARAERARRGDRACGAPRAAARRAHARLRPPAARDGQPRARARRAGRGACPACTTCARSPTSTPSRRRSRPARACSSSAPATSGSRSPPSRASAASTSRSSKPPDRVMSRTVSVEVSAFYEACHRAAGVAIHCGAAVKALHGATRVTDVETADGRRFACDVVIVGIGIVPNVELAARAGLRAANGIVVDELARTADPHIVAAGDCTNHPHRAARAARAPRIGAERDSPGEGRGRDAARRADALFRGAVVLVRPVRLEAADRGAVDGLRRGRRCAATPPRGASPRSTCARASCSPSTPSTAQKSSSRGRSSSRIARASRRTCCATRPSI